MFVTITVELISFLLLIIISFVGMINLYVPLSLQTKHNCEINTMCILTTESFQAHKHSKYSKLILKCTGPSNDQNGISISCTFVPFWL